MSGNTLAKALEAEERSKRSRKPDSRKNGIIRRARFMSSQKQLRKVVLKDVKTVEKDAFVAVGRCLEEASEALLQRWKKYMENTQDETGNKQKILTFAAAMLSTMTFFDGEERERFGNYLQKTLDGYFPGGSGGGGHVEIRVDQDESD